MNLVPTNKGVLFLLVAVLVGLYAPDKSLAQSDSYELMPAPDLWYNSVDGIRVGVRLSGRVPGNFGEGPHRLDAGLWLGTKFPDQPLSYQVTFTEPIPAISEFGNEGSISLLSSYRTGFQQHGFAFNKRWQEGFEELNYTELSVGFRGEHRFDEGYLLYPQLWQDDWLFLTFVRLDVTDTNALGRYYLSMTSDINTAGNYEAFGRGEIAFQQQIQLSDAVTVFGRVYTGLTTNETAPEYNLSRSLRTPRYWMNSGLSRARGTVPPSWIEAGNIQFTGGANLRGYLNQDIDAMNTEGAPLYNSLSAVNFEVAYPNPLDNAINRIPIVGQFVSLRSYLFFDAGTSLGISNNEESRVLTDAGPGFKFRINIPDYLGKTRGLMLRYDLPLWVSHSGDEKSFMFRHVIGIGAVITL